MSVTYPLGLSISLKFKRGGDCLKLTIYFDGRFWCGLIEYESIQGDYRACKYVFGSEPKDKELEHFIYFKLQKFVDKDDEYLNHSVSASKTNRTDKKISPKKMQRKINKEKRKPIMSTKAQLAITKSREQKKSRKEQQKSLNKRCLEKEKFNLKQKKKLEKKRGH